MILVFVTSVLLTPVLKILLPMFLFEKIFNRLIMILTVVTAFFFLRKQKISWQSFGFDFSGPWKRLASYGFIFGIGLVLSMVALEVILGPRYVRDSMNFSDMIQRFAKGMASGIAVGIVEEFFFRGFIYRWLAVRMNAATAVALSSAFYSLAHFLDNGQIFIPKHPGIKDAIRLLFGYLEPLFFHTGTVLPEFFGLFLFGVLLSVAYLRTQSLFLSIGIHAGCVLVIKWQHSFFRVGSDAFHVLYGRPPLYDGPVEWVFLVVGTFLILLFVRPSKKLLVDVCK